MYKINCTLLNGVRSVQSSWSLFFSFFHLSLARTATTHCSDWNRPIADTRFGKKKKKERERESSSRFQFVPFVENTKKNYNPCNAPITVNKLHGYFRLFFAGDGIVPLTVPTQTPDTCYLQTLTDCVNGTTTNCTLQTTSRLRLVGSVRDVIVQTSSKFYKPGETSESGRRKRAKRFALGFTGLFAREKINKYKKEVVAVVFFFWR